MVMRRLNVIALLILSFAVVLSCTKRASGSVSSLKVVNDSLTDTSSVGYHVLNAWNSSDKSGAIAVIGDPEDILPVVEDLFTCDRFNNISGKASPDGLPDFSGETIAAQLDVANSPYGGYVTDGNVKFLRELAVKNFVSALDTCCLYSPYDRSLTVAKPSAKIVVSASSYSSVYGAGDIDTLLSASGVSVPVVSSTQCVFKYALNRHPEGNICVWTTEDRAASRLYDSPFREVSASGANVPPVFAPDSFVELERRFLDVLDMYAAAGAGSSLSAMIIDDPSVDRTALGSVLDGVNESDSEEMLPYRNLLSGGFEFIFPSDAISSECFRILRERNAFTHKIAYPELKGYMSVVATDLPVSSYQEDGKFTSDYKFNRAPDSDVDTWYLIEVRNGYIPESLREMMSVRSPKSYSEYVLE